MEEVTAMIVNVTYMRIKIEGRYLEFTLGIEEDYVQFMIGKSELDDYLKCLNGETTYYPYFCDGIILSRPHPQGITTLSLDSEWGTNGTRGQFVLHNFVFPGSEIASGLHMLKTEKLKVAEWPPEELELIKRMYAPSVQIIYHDDPRHDVAGFDESVDRLVRMAEFRSHGNRVLIHISYDHGFMFNGYPSYIYTIGEGREDLGGIVFNGRQYQLYS